MDAFADLTIRHTGVEFVAGAFWSLRTPGSLHCVAEVVAGIWVASL